MTTRVDQRLIHFTQTLTDSATTSWDASLGNIALWTMGGSRTLAAPTNLRIGGRYILIITQDATGGRTITWNSVFKNSAGSMPQPNTQANAVTTFTFTSYDGTNLRLESNEAMVLLATATASSSASLDFVNLTGFENYLFVLEDVLPATNSANLRWMASTNNGSSYDNGANTYRYQFWTYDDAAGSGFVTSGGATLVNMSGGLSNGSQVGASGTIMFHNLGSTTSHKMSTQNTNQFQTAFVTYVGGGTYTGNSAAAVNAIRFNFSSGNIASGTIKCYGIRG